MAATLDTISQHLLETKAKLNVLEENVSNIKEYLAGSTGLKKYTGPLSPIDGSVTTDKAHTDEEKLEEGRKVESRHKQLVSVLKGIEKRLVGVIPKSGSTSGWLGALLTGLLGGGAGLIGIGGLKLFDLFKKIPGIQALITALGKGFGLGKLAKGVLHFLGPGLDIIKNFFKIFSKIIKGLGIAFLPVTILFGIIDTIRGAVYGFKKDKIAGAFIGAVSGLIDFLTFGLFPFKDIYNNLFKLSRGIADTLFNLIRGNFSKALSAFSDTILHLITSIFSMIEDALLNLVANIVDWLGFDSIAEKIRDFSKGFDIKVLMDEWSTMLSTLATTAFNAFWTQYGSMVYSIMRKLGMDTPGGERAQKSIDFVEGDDNGHIRHLLVNTDNAGLRYQIEQLSTPQAKDRLITDSRARESQFGVFSALMSRLGRLNKFLADPVKAENLRAEFPGTYEQYVKEQRLLEEFRKRTVMPTIQYINQYGSGISIPADLLSGMSRTDILQNRPTTTTIPNIPFQSTPQSVFAQPTSNFGLQTRIEHMNRPADFGKVLTNLQKTTIVNTGGPKEADKIYAPSPLRNNEPSIKTIMDMVMRGYAVQ